MTVTVADLKQHLMLFSDDSYDSELAQLLLVSAGYIETYLGYSFDNAVAFPNGVPAMVYHAQLMAAATLFENRSETSSVAQNKVAITINRLLSGCKRIEV